MSTLAGIFYFDPARDISREDLRKLWSAARDSEGAWHTSLQRGVAMIYRPFPTTKEEATDQQPLTQSHVTLCWDGRLDNRDDLLTSLELSEAMPDSEIVLHVYLRWGHDGLEKLIGDWALALWDIHRGRLLLARDFIGTRRLFYRVFHNKMLWATDIEPLLAASEEPVSLDAEYIAGGFLLRSPLERTAYCEIRSVIPAQSISWNRAGSAYCQPYWRLRPCSSSHMQDRGYEEEFLYLLQKAVKRRLRSDRPILAELSGGMDSSSVVCVADSVLLQQREPDVTTVSYFDPDEPSGDERPYFSLIEQKRKRAGHHISLTSMRLQYEACDLAPLPAAYFTTTPGAFYRTYIWAKELDRIRAEVGARVVLSGLGGDELLGGVQYEAPELANYFEALQLHAFFRSSLRWSLRRRRPIVHLWKDVWHLVRARSNPQQFVLRSQVKAPSWLRLPMNGRYDALGSFSNWKSLSASQASMEWNRYLLASQLTCMDPPLIGNVERRYPLLDRELYEFVARVPRHQIISAGARRSLMRRALRGLVPDEILTRRSKWFGEAAALRALRSDYVQDFLREPWCTDGIVVDLPVLRKSAERAREGLEGEVRLLTFAIGVEQWARQQFHRLRDLGHPPSPGHAEGSK